MGKRPRGKPGLRRQETYDPINYTVVNVIIIICKYAFYFTRIDESAPPCEVCPPNEVLLRLCTWFLYDAMRFVKTRQPRFLGDF